MKNLTKILHVDDDPIFTFLAREELESSAERFALPEPKIHSASNANVGIKYFEDLLALHFGRREIGELFLISDLNMPCGDEGLDLLRTAKAELKRKLAEFQEEERDSIQKSVRFALLTSADLTEVKRKINGDPILADVTLISKGELDNLAKFVFPNLRQQAA